MKKSISVSGIILVIILFLGYTSISCGKKEMDMHDLTVSMNYTPNPALKDSIISISFVAKEGDVLTNLTNFSCTYKISTGSTTNPITIAQNSTGTYNGTCTFTTTGTYTIAFMYMHSNENASKNYTIIVQ